MDRTRLRTLCTRAAYVAVVTAVLANAGCLLVAAGAAGGAAAGYFYFKGKVCELFSADVPNTQSAVHAALADLGMRIEKEEPEAGGDFIVTHDVDGDTVKIHVDAMPSQVPAGGPVTRVCVRVGAFGDHPVSERVLYQVSAHLTQGAVPGLPAPTAPPPLAGQPAPAVPAATPTAAARTGEPPLAN